MADTNQTDDLTDKVFRSILFDENKTPKQIAKEKDTFKEDLDKFLNLEENKKYRKEILNILEKKADEGTLQIVNSSGVINLGSLGSITNVVIKEIESKNANSVGDTTSNTVKDIVSAKEVADFYKKLSEMPIEKIKGYYEDILKDLDIPEEQKEEMANIFTELTQNGVLQRTAEIMDRNETNSDKMQEEFTEIQKELGLSKLTMQRAMAAVEAQRKIIGNKGIIEETDIEELRKLTYHELYNDIPDLDQRGKIVAFLSKNDKNIAKLQIEFKNELEEKETKEDIENFSKLLIERGDFKDISEDDLIIFIAEAKSQFIFDKEQEADKAGNKAESRKFKKERKAIRQIGINKFNERQEEIKKPEQEQSNIDVVADKIFDMMKSMYKVNNFSEESIQKGMFEYSKILNNMSIQGNYDYKAFLDQYMQTQELSYEVAGIIEVLSTNELLAENVPQLLADDKTRVELLEKLSELSQLPIRDFEELDSKMDEMFQQTPDIINEGPVNEVSDPEKEDTVAVNSAVIEEPDISADIEEQEKQKDESDRPEHIIDVEEKGFRGIANRFMENVRRAFQKALPSGEDNTKGTTTDIANNANLGYNSPREMAIDIGRRIQKAITSIVPKREEDEAINTPNIYQSEESMRQAQEDREIVGDDVNNKAVTNNLNGLDRNNPDENSQEERKNIIERLQDRIKNILNPPKKLEEGKGAYDELENKMDKYELDPKSINYSGQNNPDDSRTIDGNGKGDENREDDSHDEK